MGRIPEGSAIPSDDSFPEKFCPTNTAVRWVSELTSGVWSLWRVGLRAGSEEESLYLPVFVDEVGRPLQPTARLVWDRLIDSANGVSFAPGSLDAGQSQSAFERSRLTAEQQGQSTYAELLQRHTEKLRRERTRATAAFAARRVALSRIGLAGVRNHRLAQLQVEEDAALAALRAKEEVVPELSAVMLLRVAGREEAH